MKRKKYGIPIFDNPGVIPLFLVLTLCSGFFTYEGAAMAIAMGSIDWMGQVGAVIFAIGSSTAIFLIWTSLPQIALKCETVRDRLIVIGQIMVGMVMVACVSSWLAAVGIAGSSALQNHIDHLIASYENDLTKRFTESLAIKTFQPDLEQAAALYRTRRDAEIKDGAYTGRKGKGTVGRLLGIIAQRFDALDQSIDGELLRQKAVAQKARHALSAMRAVANQPGSPSDRMEQFAIEADLLRSLLSELNAQGLLNGLGRALRALPREIALQSISAQTKKGVRDQKSALKRIEVELTETVDQLRAELLPLASAPQTPIPTITRLNAIEAVLRYPLQNAPYWAGALAIDFTPFFLLFCSMLITYSRGRRGEFTDSVGDLTVRDLKSAQHGLESIRDGRVSQDSIDKLHDDLTGDETFDEDEDVSDEPNKKNEEGDDDGSV